MFKLSTSRSKCGGIVGYGSRAHRSETPSFSPYEADSLPVVRQRQATDSARCSFGLNNCRAGDPPSPTSNRGRDDTSICYISVSVVWTSFTCLRVRIHINVDVACSSSTLYHTRCRTLTHHRARTEHVLDIAFITIVSLSATMTSTSKPHRASPIHVPGAQAS